MTTVPRPIPDCTAAGGEAGTTVCTVEAGSVTTDSTVVVATPLLEVPDEAVSVADAGGDWLVCTDDDVFAAELAVVLADGWDDVGAAELDVATLLCWPLDDPVTGAADSVPVGATNAAGEDVAAAAPSPTVIAATIAANSMSTPAILVLRNLFRRILLCRILLCRILLCRSLSRRSRCTGITSSALDVTAASTGFSIRPGDLPPSGAP